MTELFLSIIIALHIWLVALELRQMNKFKNK